MKSFVTMISLGLVVVTGVACTSQRQGAPRIPALEYSRSLGGIGSAVGDEARARVQFADAPGPEGFAPVGAIDATVPAPEKSAGDLHSEMGIEPPPYRGPLRDGEVSSNPSLWREGEGAHSLFHDFRAFQPMDLVTVLVTEVTEGRKQADTRVNSQSTLTAAISALFGLEKSVPAANPDVDPTALIDATTKTQVEGRGETLRRGQLKGTISCMVQEVLPSGILRIQGEKIISVNDEEQIMVMSGLVRPRDVNSRNEVDSAKIANMRIDYYGKGSLGVIQSPGWFTKILMRLWPF